MLFSLKKSLLNGKLYQARPGIVSLLASLITKVLPTFGISYASYIVIFLFDFGFLRSVLIFRFNDLWSLRFYIKLMKEKSTTWLSEVKIIPLTDLIYLDKVLHENIIRKRQQLFNVVNPCDGKRSQNILILLWIRHVTFFMYQKLPCK